MVHGRPAYMVACGPRTKGSKPGSVSVNGRPSASFFVYSGRTAMPSGVTQVKAARSPRGADLVAAFCQVSRLEEFSSGSLMGNLPLHGAVQGERSGPGCTTMHTSYQSAFRRARGDTRSGAVGSRPLM